MSPFAAETVVGIIPLKPTTCASASFSIPEFPTKPAASDTTPTIVSPFTALCFTPPDPIEIISPTTAPPVIM